ncbi:MAG: glycosyltransferase family 4 protein, partial [Mesorhizobium sp.]
MRITLAVTGTIPSRGYGGTQRQVDWLAGEFARLGHRVVLIVDPGSSHPLCEVRHASSEAQCRAAIPADADIVHFHSWFLDVPFPTLNTAHG